MKQVIDNIWKSLNIILILLIVGSAVYIYMFNPGEMMGERAAHQDLRVRDVMQNSQQPQTVAWGAGYIQEPQPGTMPDPFAANPVAGTGNNYQQAYDPYGIQQVATQDPNMITKPIGALDKILQEGHWIGLEVIPLTSTIALANSIPENVAGVLIDEVTLISAEAGLLAGDVITAIGSVKVQDLKTFKAATWQIANSTNAGVTVYRNGSYLDISIKAVEQLGVAQMEAAPMILPTDVSPHGYYGPCDKCHSISKTAKNTGQLRKDAGDVLTVATPPIQWGAKATHRNRGTCTNCHSII